jgi:DNA-binding NtrC family response regulator
MTKTGSACGYVLVVDDDYDIRDMLVTFLRENGFRALCAVDREEALAVLAENPVSIILLDYMMPGPSATKFLDIVNWNYPGTQIILMTAGDRVDAVADTLGLQRFIGKPFDEGTLLKMLGPIKGS